MRLTNDIRNAAAQKILAPLRAKIERLENEVVKATIEYLKTCIPEEVHICAKKHSSFFVFSKFIQVEAGGYKRYVGFPAKMLVPAADKLAPGKNTALYKTLIQERITQETCAKLRKQLRTDLTKLRTTEQMVVAYPETADIAGTEKVNRETIRKALEKAVK